MPRKIPAVPGSLPKPLLNPQLAAKKFKLSQHAPSPDLEFFVQNHWLVTWDLPDNEPFRQDILPYPSVNVVFESGRSVVAGVTRGKASREISGRGCALGIKFKPGAFYPFLRSPVSTLTNKLIPLGKRFGPIAADYETRIMSSADETERVELAERFLRELRPERDPNLPFVASLVQAMMNDRTLTKVEALQSRCGLNERALQRLFSRYVGVSPKWVIRLYRLQEAAERVSQGERLDWSALALDLGYFDQSHFSKDFKNVVGQSPAAYARSTRTAS